MAVRDSSINRKRTTRLRLRVLASQVRAAELPALELFLLPEDVDEGFADVAEEVAERYECELGIVETGLDGDLGADALGGVDGGGEVGLEGCQVRFIDGCLAVGKGDHFWSVSWVFMDGWLVWGRRWC
jgi:hypothetical protein